MQGHGYILIVGFLSTKIKINFWAVVLLASCPNAAVVVETRDELVQNTSQTHLRLRASNGTGDPLRNVEFRYFLATKSSPAVLEKYYLPGADAAIDSSSMGAFVKISVPIFSPNADLVLGQSSKKLYGRFLGKNVTVHQYSTVRHVAFDPESATEIARRGR